METFITHRCPMCGGVSHPASGCVYTPTFIVCGPCVREGWKWLLAHINGKGGRSGVFFYDHATSIHNTDMSDSR